MAETKRTVRVDFASSGAAQVDKGVSVIAQRLKELNQAAQAKGLSGDASIFGLLKGAGAAAGVHFLANGIAGVAAATRQFADGAIDGKTALLEAGKAVPVLGSVVSALHEVAGAFDAIIARKKGMDWSAFAEAERRGAEQFAAFAGDVRAKLDDARGIAAAAGMNETDRTHAAAISKVRDQFLEARRLRDRLRGETGHEVEDILRGRTPYTADGAAPEVFRSAERIAELERLAREQQHRADDELARARQQADAERRRQSAALGGRIFAGIRGTVGGAVGGIGEALGGVVARERERIIAAQAEREAADELLREARIDALQRTNEPEARRLLGLESQRRRAMQYQQILASPATTADQKAQAQAMIDALDPAVKSITESNDKTIRVLERLESFLFGNGGGGADTSPVSGQPILE